MALPIVILHGWTRQLPSQAWGEVKELLEKENYQVYLPELPGFGQTSAPTKPWAIDDYVEWLKNFCKENNVSQIFLVGHSFGGSVAVKFSIKYPGKIKKLILVNSAGIRRKKLTKEIQKEFFHLLNKFSFLPFYSLARKIVYRTLFPQSDYIFAEGVMREICLKVLSEDISPLFSEIKLPTLIVWGKEDKITPLEDAYLMKEKIEGAKLEIIPHVKHTPHLEAPKILAEKIVQFIKINAVG